VFIIDVGLNVSNMDEEGVEVNNFGKGISKEEMTSFKGKVSKNVPKKSQFVINQHEFEFPHRVNLIKITYCQHC
jgi:hypothetical protein